MKYLLIVVLLLSLLSCELQQKVTPTEVEVIKNKLVYFSDKYGNCYAAISNFNNYGNIISITSIPCKK